MTGERTVDDAISGLLRDAWAMYEEADKGDMSRYADAIKVLEKAKTLARDHFKASWPVDEAMAAIREDWDAAKLKTVKW